jgi:hypothetical protein
VRGVLTGVFRDGELGRSSRGRRELHKSLSDGGEQQQQVALFVTAAAHLVEQRQLLVLVRMTPSSGPGNRVP